MFNKIISERAKTKISKITISKVKGDPKKNISVKIKEEGRYTITREQLTNAGIYILPSTLHKLTIDLWGKTILFLFSPIFKQTTFGTLSYFNDDAKYDVTIENGSITEVTGKRSGITFKGADLIDFNKIKGESSLKNNKKIGNANAAKGGTIYIATISAAAGFLTGILYFVKALPIFWPLGALLGITTLSFWVTKAISNYIRTLREESESSILSYKAWKEKVTYNRI